MVWPQGRANLQVTVCSSGHSTTHRPWQNAVVLYLLIRLFEGRISAQMWRAEKVGRVLLTLRVLEGCVLCYMLGVGTAIVMKITDN